MRRLLRCAAAACALMALALPTAQAVELPPSPIIKTEFLLHAPQVEEDGVVWAGVTFTMPPNWHIYWQNPGDSGIPTTIHFTLPDGITAGGIVWPVPERIEASGLINYGYSDRVTLPVPLTADRDSITGAIEVTAKWLACNDVCVPESATFSAQLPTASPAAEAELNRTLLAAPQAVTDADGDAAYSAVDDVVRLGITGPGFLPEGAAPVTRALFFPREDGVVTNNDPQTFRVNDEATALTITMKRGNSDLPEHWTGVLLLERSTGTQSYDLVARRLGAATPATTGTAAAPQSNVTLWLALGLAFLGGVLLNIMPCVLPILALKALALTKKASASRIAAARQGVAYTAGVVVSFLLIAGAMLALKSTGAAIGWGFQLQHSGFVAVLLGIMLLVSANLLGWFELPVLFGARATGVDEDKFLGSFFTGVLAVLVATPCTAPFMATALGATLAFPTVEALLVFIALGLGMAAPFLIISLWPAARRLLPKPGAWMQRFRKLLAIPMLATAMWLAWVLLQLTTVSSATVPTDHTAYSATELQRLRDAGTPVLVDATAAWCLTCKVNERVALQPEAMQQFFRDEGITLMVADWTANDPAITEYLASFGRNGVPLYVYYPPRKAPVVLPQLLTPSLVRDAIRAANG